MPRIPLIVVMALALIGHCAQDIIKYGARPNEDTIECQQNNQKAIMAAIEAAKISTGDGRTVKVPKGNFYTFPIKIVNAHQLKLEIQGKLTASRSISHWPKKQRSTFDPIQNVEKDGPQYLDFIHVQNSTEIQIHGGGKIDGRGYKWWVDSWIVSKKYTPAGTSRPHLITIDNVKNLSIHDLVLKNSPCYHIRTDQTQNAVIYNIDIKVNATAQINLLKRLSLLGVIPIFPLNTDGIDPAGRNFHIYNITCQNYDDVIVPKPSHRNQGPITCTQNMLIENITVRLGVGLSIGSVPPNDQTNCIRNITFRNVFMQRPLKGIYIKTNPGTTGDGIIDNIVYENITMIKPVWWAIYLGPQQQKQPDRGGPGCMFYPFYQHGTCSTQPNVVITNIVLKDVSVHESLLFPIIVRCNVTKPCKNITFDNVNADKWRISSKGPGFVCEYAEVTQRKSYPKLTCLKETKLRTSEVEKTIQEESYQNPIVFGAAMLEQMEKGLLENPYQEEDDEMFDDEIQN